MEEKFILRDVGIRPRVPPVTASAVTTDMALLDPAGAKPVKKKNQVSTPWFKINIYLRL